MPAPLPPYRPSEPTKRLSFLPSPKVRPLPSSGGRPTHNETHIIQLEAIFDPIVMDGHWRYIQFPQDIEFDDYEVFERFCKKHLPVPAENFSFIMDYIHNFQVVNFDTITNEFYPVIPRPTGYDVPIPIPGAPGPYLG